MWAKRMQTCYCPCEAPTKFQRYQGQSKLSRTVQFHRLRYHRHKNKARTISDVSEFCEVMTQEPFFLLLRLNTTCSGNTLK